MRVTSLCCMDTGENGVLEGRVLCVDDSPDNLGLLDAVLTREGMLVTTCSSAEEAIEVLARERFDIMISDLSMPPGLDGFDLAHALRKMEAQDPSRQATPSIAVSGDAMRPSRKRHFADFQVYVRKPFENGRLVYIVERLLEAEDEAVKLGSLGIWEAMQASEAAALATQAAATATSAAVESTAAAEDATSAAVDATTAATTAKSAANAAEAIAAAAGAKAPLPLR